MDLKNGFVPKINKSQELAFADYYDTLVVETCFGKQKMLLMTIKAKKHKNSHFFLWVIALFGKVWHTKGH